MRTIRYETWLSILLGLTFGVVIFDRGAVSLLAPFIVGDLRLTNTQLGIAASIVSLTWAAGGFLIGRRSDATGRRKSYLILAVIIFSLCSAASGLVGGFVGLLMARLLMGFAEGSVPPLTTALLFQASSPQRRGVNMGLYASLTGVIAASAPLILVGLATQYDWRVAFFVAGVPGLIAAGLLALFVREGDRSRTPADEPHVTSAPSRLPDLLRQRNIWLSAAISSLVLAFILVTAIFLPLYLVQVRHLTPIEMGLVMTGGGIAALVGGFGVPALSDRVGRKPVIVAFGLVGATLPVVCLLGAVPVFVLAGLYTVVSLAFALPNLTIMTVPAESVGLRDRGAALGLVQGVAEIVGGFGAPALVGMVADATSLTAAPLIAGGCALGVALLSLLLQETAPTRQGKVPAGVAVAAA